MTVVVVPLQRKQEICISFVYTSAIGYTTDWFTKPQKKLHDSKTMKLITRHNNIQLVIYFIIVRTRVGYAVYT